MLLGVKIIKISITEQIFLFDIKITRHIYIQYFNKKNIN